MNFFKRFSYIYCNDHLVFFFGLFIQWIRLIFNMKWTLHLWDESRSELHSFYILLDSICWYFVKDLHTHVHEGLGSVMLSSTSICCCCHVHLLLVSLNKVETIPSSFVFWISLCKIGIIILSLHIWWMERTNEIIWPWNFVWGKIFFIEILYLQ